MKREKGQEKRKMKKEMRRSCSGNEKKRIKMKE
jgi:hypothetical protein